MGKLRQLLIPHKTSSKQGQPEYGDDMRAIEIWAQKVGGVIEITSTGATVTITNPFGPVVNLEVATSSGGGAQVQECLVGFGPDVATINPGFLIPSGFSSTGVEAGLGDGADLIRITSIPSITPGFFTTTWGESWYCPTNGGDSVTMLPGITFPAWTPNPGTDASFGATIMAADPTWTNFYVIASVTKTMGPSGGTYLFTDTDFSGGTVISNGGADLSLQPGPGPVSGSGLVTAAGGKYYGQTQIWIEMPTNITFVEF